MFSKTYTIFYKTVELAAQEVDKASNSNFSDEELPLILLLTDD